MHCWHADGSRTASSEDVRPRDALGADRSPRHVWAGLIETATTRRPKLRETVPKFMTENAPKILVLAATCIPPGAKGLRLEAQSGHRYSCTRRTAKHIYVYDAKPGVKSRSQRITVQMQSCSDLLFLRSPTLGAEAPLANAGKLQSSVSTAQSCRPQLFSLTS